MNYLHFIKRISRASLYIVCLVVFFSVVVQTQAASIYISPSQPQIPVGKTQVFRVSVNTQGVAINTAEGVISFDPKLIEIVSVSKSNSVLNLWIEEPSFSNSTGKITFNGGAITPGYTGSSGELFTVTARGKVAGSVTFAFSDVSIRENDGAGTDVSSAKINSVATITAGVNPPVVKTPTVEPKKPVIAALPVVPVLPSKLVPVAPTLTSQTHPDQTAWYNSRNLDVTWIQSTDAYGSQSIFDSKPETVAGGPIQSGVTVKPLRGVRNGVSYLHVRQVGAAGVSPTSHFAVHIDTDAPRDVQISASSSRIDISATDDLSGVDHITLVIGTHDYGIIPVSGDTVSYMVPADIESGSYEVTVGVFDKAGNVTNLKKTLTIMQPSMYELTTETADVSIDADVLIHGQTSVKDGEVSLSIKNPAQKVENFSLETDTTGAFVFRLPHVKEGQYVIWGIDNHAGQSNVIEINVRTSYAQMLLHLCRQYGMILISILLLIWVIILNCRLKHKKTDMVALKAIRKLEEDTNKSLKEIKEEASKQLTYLDELSQVRTLTKSEKDRYDWCKKILD